MKQPRKRSQIHTQEAKMDMSSLIDISFLLLIYFLVATTLVMVEKDVPMQVGGDPEESNRVAKMDPVQLEILENGAIVFGGDEGMEVEGATTGEVAKKARPLSNLRQHLEQFVIAPAFEEEPMVQISVADGVNHQRFTEVMACLNDLELTQVAIMEQLD